MTMTAEEVANALTALRSWQGDETGIHRTFTFPDFRKAMAWQQGCIDGIEERQHHPEWCNVYNTVRVSLKTHDAGDRVTEKDLDLAQFLDEMSGRYDGG